MGKNSNAKRRMSAGAAIIALVALTAVLSGGLQAAEVRGPRIVAKELAYDFGKVVQGTDASHVFAITNGGSEPLDIQRVQSS